MRVLGEALFLAEDAEGWLDQNGWIFSLLAAILVLILASLVIVSLVYSKRIAAQLEKSSLKLVAKLAYDSDSMEEYLEISIFNNGFRDVNIKDFGLRYKNQNVSLIGEFTERRASKSHTVDVPVSSSITYKLNPERVERFVISHNFNARNIASIYLVAIDSYGTETVTKVSSLSRVFNERQRARILLAKRRIHNEKVQAYKETHEGNEPLSEGVYRTLHRKEIAIPELIRKSEDFMKTDKPRSASDPEPQRNYSSYSSASSTRTNGNTTRSTGSPFSGGMSERRGDTRDLKVTYLNLDPLTPSDEENEKGK